MRKSKNELEKLKKEELVYICDTIGGLNEKLEAENKSLQLEKALETERTLKAERERESLTKVLMHTVQVSNIKTAKDSQMKDEFTNLLKEIVSVGKSFLGKEVTNGN